MPAIADRLRELDITLPEAPKPVAAYIPAVRTGNLIIVAGQIPMRDGKLIATGSVPSAISLEQARQAARQCALNGLAIVADMLDGDLDRVRRIVRLGVFVASDPGFADQPKVGNGASEVLHEIFGESGRHARSAIGCIALPLNAAVEVEMMVEVE
jgi:enamine deaminase RidA (YjgF/YER057c/UK114 family)